MSPRPPDFGSAIQMALTVSSADNTITAVLLFYATRTIIKTKLKKTKLNLDNNSSNIVIIRNNNNVKTLKFREETETRRL